jgi:hypothetical protein
VSLRSVERVHLGQRRLHRRGLRGDSGRVARRWRGLLLRLPGRLRRVHGVGRDVPLPVAHLQRRVPRRRRRLPHRVRRGALTACRREPGEALFRDIPRRFGTVWRDACRRKDTYCRWHHGCSTVGGSHASRAWMDGGNCGARRLRGTGLHRDRGRRRRRELVELRWRLGRELQRWVERGFQLVERRIEQQLGRQQLLERGIQRQLVGRRGTRAQESSRRRQPVLPATRERHLQFRRQ